MTSTLPSLKKPTKVPPKTGQFTWSSYTMKDSRNLVNLSFYVRAGQTHTNQTPIRHSVIASDNDGSGKMKERKVGYEEMLRNVYEPKILSEIVTPRMDFTANFTKTKTAVCLFIH